MPNRRPGVVDRIVKSFRKGRFFSTKRPERLLQELFTRVFVQGSKDRGLIPEFMELAGDGSPFESCGNPYGIKVCDCRKKGIFKCDCLRRYSDSYANWGYDSYRNVYFFGRNLYSLSCVNGVHELPVYLRFGQGSRHDSVLMAFSVTEAWPLFDEVGLKVTTFIGDSAHDANALYGLLKDYGAKPVIDLKGELKEVLELNKQGIPLCPKKFLMTYWGYEKKKNRFKWRCPKKVGKRKHRDQVDCEKSSRSSYYGYMRHTKPEGDMRIFTEIPRGSKKWRRLYRKRTVTERMNKRYNDFGLDTAKVRDHCYWYHLAHLAVMNIHLDAWVASLSKQKSLDKKGLLMHALGILSAA